MADFEKLKRLFPRASKAFFKANTDVRLPDPEQQRVCGKTLDTVLPRKEKSYERAHVRFTAFSIRPTDPDNLAGGSKALLDAVKNLRLIPDDDPYSIEFEVRQRHVDHVHQEKTLIEISYI